MTNNNLAKQVSLVCLISLALIIMMLVAVFKMSMPYGEEKQQMTRFLKMQHGCEIKVLEFDIDTSATYEWATDESKIYRMSYILPNELLKRQCIGCYNAREKKYTHIKMDDKPWDYLKDMDRLDESQTKYGGPDDDKPDNQ